MAQPLISVIVPVYKVEAYLDKCVSSITGQTYQNLEIILVDDGSPDNCPAMCDEWAKKDSRIKVIHKENGGGAQARNMGLDHATGSHIGFVDSDDFVLPQMFETLLNVLQETDGDIAECEYICTDSDEPVVESANGEIICYNTEQALQENIKDHVCRQLVWNKLYVRKTVDTVRFVEGKFIDDEFFTYRAIGNAKKVAVTPQKLYCYRQQAGSAMHQAYSAKWLDAIEAKQRRLAFIEEKFPALTDDAKHNLLFTCMYHTQLALQHMAANDWERAKNMIMPVALRLIPTVKPRNSKERIWLNLARISFVNTCKLRNFLKIGF